MLSPIDRRTGLETVTLESGLQVMRCPASSGFWLRPAMYWAWRETHVPELREPFGEDMQPNLDSAAGKRCPEDGAFLIRHRVGHGLDFHLDRCGHCGGIWFDHFEWQAVIQAGLAGHLNLIFTSAWQAEVRRREIEERDQKRLSDRLGKADFSRLLETKTWIDTHPRGPELLAYLRGDQG